MRSLLNVLLIFTIIAISNSCEKDSLKPEISNPETIDQSKDFLKELRIDRSDRSSVYFIRGEFDGKLIYFTTISDNYYNDDSSWNGIFINSAIGLDQINLIRMNCENSVQLSFYINQSKIFTRQLPYNIKAGEDAVIELKNLDTVKPGSSDNDPTFSGATYSSFTIQITSLVDNILEGKFEGPIKSKSGSTIMVKNGRFRIKVKVHIY